MIHRMIAAMIVGFALGCTSPGMAPPREPEPEREAAKGSEIQVREVAPPVQVVPEEVELSWYEQAELLTDRTTLTEAFAARDYTPPDGTFLLAARVVEGAGQPAFQYYSLGDTAFLNSDGKYWPASTIKLMAAVGALSHLHAVGLTGAARLEFRDGRGLYHGNALNLVRNAIIDSNNVAFDRLVRIAGFDGLNGGFLSPENGFPHFSIQCPYDPLGKVGSLRESPLIAYREGKLKGELPARDSTREELGCSDGANCVTLFELLDGLRRVVLHDELPEGDRFPLHARDVGRLREYLLAAKNKLEPGASEGLRHPVRVYNKAGRLPLADHNDHALVVDERTGERYLVALSVPERTGDRELVEGQIVELARHTFRALKKLPTDGVSLARAGGLPVSISAAAGEQGKGTYVVSVTVEGDVDRLTLWNGREQIAQTSGPSLRATLPNPVDTVHLLVVRAERGGKVVGYRTRGLAVPQTL